MRTRARILTLCAFLVGAALLAACTDDTQWESSSDTPRTGDEEAGGGKPAFFATSAAKGTFDDGVVTLEGLDELLLVEDRPSRRVAQLGLAGFAEAFDDAFADATPNAVLTHVTADGTRATAVVVIDSFEHDPTDGSVRMVVDLTSGELPSTFTDATLTIDDIAASTQSMTIRNDSADEVTVALFWPTETPLTSLVTTSASLPPGTSWEFTAPPSRYRLTAKVSASDTWGNWTPERDVVAGMRLEYVQGMSGDELWVSPGYAPRDSVVVDNHLRLGGMRVAAMIWGEPAITSPTIDSGRSVTFRLPDVPSVAVSDLAVGAAVPASLIETSTPGVAGKELVVTGSAATGFRIDAEPAPGSSDD